VQGLEQFVPELREHHFLHELMAQLSTAAMSKNDLVVICDWDRAGGGKKRRLVHDPRIMTKSE